MPVMRQGTMADPTEVSPDLCRGVSETREKERDKDEEGREETEKRGVTLDYSPARAIVQTPGAYLDTPLDVSVCVSRKVTHIFNEPAHLLPHSLLFIKHGPPHQPEIK